MRNATLAKVLAHRKSCLTASNDERIDSCYCHAKLYPFKEKTSDGETNELLDPLIDL